MMFKEGDLVVRIANPQGGNSLLEIGSVWRVFSVMPNGDLKLEGDHTPTGGYYLRKPYFFELAKYPEEEELVQAYETLKSWVG